MVNSKGFSLVEIMIATSIIGVAALLLSKNDGLYVSQNYNMRRVCDEHAQSIISAVQEETYYRAIQNSLPTTAGSRSPLNAFTATRAIPAANLNWYWQK